VPQALGKRSRPAIAEPIKPVHAEARTTANRLAGRGKVRRESVHAEHEGIGGNRGSKEGRTRRGAWANVRREDEERREDEKNKTDVQFLSRCIAEVRIHHYAWEMVRIAGGPDKGGWKVVLVGG
jgi:hypothetical protein